MCRKPTAPGERVLSSDVVGGELFGRFHAAQAGRGEAVGHLAGGFQHAHELVPPAGAPAGLVLTRALIGGSGAGDAYASGFLFGRLAGESFERCALYGAIAGAHACTVPAAGGDAIDRAALPAEAAVLSAVEADA